MKFLLFSDLHYVPGSFKSAEWEALRTFQTHAEQAGCDMMIHCGDFTHPTRHPDYVKAYNDFHIPSYHCFGNHDMDTCTLEEAMAAYRMPAPYYFFDQGGYRFIVTNTSYYVDENGEVIAYSHGNYFKYPDTRETMPAEELAWLERTIGASQYPCILFSHASFERCDGLRNREEVLRIIDDANAKKPHSVLMCINGHHHRDNLRIRNGVLYFDMNSASFEWVGIKHDFYPAEECERYRNLNRTICYNDPLHAVITLEGTTITIEGMESSMYLGVTRPMIGAPEFDRAGRPVTPTVQNAKITLN